MSDQCIRPNCSQPVITGAVWCATCTEAGRQTAREAKEWWQNPLYRNAPGWGRPHPPRTIPRTKEK